MSDLRDQEAKEGDDALPTESAEEAFPRTQSIMSVLAASNLSDIADRDVEIASGNSRVASRVILSKFGIDIDRYKLLLDDFE